MGFNKCFVSDLENVKKQYEILGHAAFKSIYIKRDVFVGPQDAIDFIKDKLLE